MVEQEKEVEVLCAEIARLRQCEEQLRHENETLRLEAEQLRVSEANACALFEQSPVATIIYDADGRFLRVNRAWEHLWELPASLFLDRNVLQPFAKEIEELKKGKLEREVPDSEHEISTNGSLSGSSSRSNPIVACPLLPYIRRTFAGETVAVPPILYDPVPLVDSGRKHWVQCVIYPTLDPDGNLRQVVVLQHEMRALKESEDARRRAEVALLQERERTAQERAAQLVKANNVLKRSLDSLAAQPELEAFLQCLVDEVAVQMSAAGAHLFLYDQVARSLRLCVATDRSEDGSDWRSVPDMELFRHPVPADGTAAWEHFSQAKAPIICNLDTDDPPHLPGTRKWHRARGHQRVMCVMLQLGERSLGMLGLSFREGQGATFSPEEVELAQAMAQQATLAIELTRLAEQSRQTAVLQERNRLAREIHDTLAQTLTGVVVHQEAAKMFLQPEQDEVLSHIAQTLELARQGLNEARRSVWELRPESLQVGGLPTALSHLAESMTRGLDVAASFGMRGEARSLPPNVEADLLRITQEALTNTLKHAHAQYVYIELIFEDEEVRLRVQDDGIGFDNNQWNGGENANGSFGLVGMRERVSLLGSDLMITTLPGKGTEIAVTVPLPKL